MAKIGWKTKEQVEKEIHDNKSPFELLAEEVAALKVKVEALENKKA